MITRINYEVPEIKFEIKDDKSNIGDFFCADVHGGRSFLQNDGGYPMNDVDQILRQQDEQVRQSLLNQLVEVPTSGVPADTPNSELLLSLRSRYQQSPGEMVSWYEKQLEIAELRAESQKVENTEKISFDNNQNDAVDNV